MVFERFLRFKYTSFAILASGFIGWDQIRRLKNNLETATSTTVWTRIRHGPEYIFIDCNTTEGILEKFEMGGLTRELHKMVNLYLWLRGKLKGSQLYEDLFAIQQNLAWKLLRIAQSNDFNLRQRALQDLTLLPNLSDATCTQIAQASDMEIAVGLARTKGVDLRLLLDPPGWKQVLDENDLMRRVHEFLLQLDKQSPHPCIQYVIAQLFAENDDKGFDDDVGFLSNQPDAILKCLEAILHHSWLGNNVESIVQLGGVRILVDLYKFLSRIEGQTSSQLQSLVFLSRIYSNLSMNSECQKQLFSSGSFKILAQLMRHENVRISVPAGRALINCDKESDSRFHRNLYVVHPLFRPTNPSSSPKIDVVFIHGLLGSLFVTWRQRDVPSSKQTIRENLYISNFVDVPDVPLDCDTSILRGLRKVESRPMEIDEKRTQCWPMDWLPRDVEDIRVIGVNFDTNISMWTWSNCPVTAPNSNRLTLNDRTSHLIEIFKAAGIGKRPIVWLAHSMGGLLLKDVLIKCKLKLDPGNSIRRIKARITMMTILKRSFLAGKIAINHH